MNKICENNIATLSGVIESVFVFDHETHEEKFYSFYLSVNRTSGAADVLPVVVSERLLDISKDLREKEVAISGQYRSFNKKDAGKTHLVLNLFATEIELKKKVTHENNVKIIGFLCKNPVYRLTPKGRNIADLLVAVNRSYGKSDYIPCICWGRDAKFISLSQIGTQVHIDGRIQSREYVKKLEDGTEKTRVAYEVSVNSIGILEEKEIRQ